MSDNCSPLTFFSQEEIDTIAQSTPEELCKNRVKEEEREDMMIPVLYELWRTERYEDMSAVVVNLFKILDSDKQRFYKNMYESGGEYILFLADKGETKENIVDFFQELSITIVRGLDENINMSRLSKEAKGVFRIFMGVAVRNDYAETLVEAAKANLI